MSPSLPFGISCLSDRLVTFGLLVSVKLASSTKSILNPTLGTVGCVYDVIARVNGGEGSVKVTDLQLRLARNVIQFVRISIEPFHSSPQQPASRHDIESSEHSVITD